jgi:hypothetical protein
MRNILSSLTILLISCSAATAGDFSGGAPMSLAQYQGDTRTRTDDRRPRPQRYVCVVPPARATTATGPMSAVPMRVVSAGPAAAKTLSVPAGWTWISRNYFSSSATASTCGDQRNWSIGVTDLMR